MTPVRAAIIVLWVMFWVYWLGSALAAKSSVRGSGRWDLAMRGLTGVAVALFLVLSGAGGLHVSSLNVTGPVPEAAGIILLLAGLGTAIAVNLIGLPLLVLLAGYFLVAVRTEERHLSAVFPQAYPAYQARSKALIPFVV